MSLLNMALVCIRVGLGTSHFVIFASMGLGNLFWPLICSLPHHHDLRSLDVKYCQIQCRITVVFKRSFPLHLSTSLWFSVDPNSLSSFSSISCRWCGKNYGPPSTRSLPVDFSSLSKNLIWRLPSSTSLYASMVGSSHSTQGSHHLPLIEWFFECSTSYHYSHPVDYTGCTLRAIFIISVFSRSC